MSRFLGAIICGALYWLQSRENEHARRTNEDMAGELERLRREIRALRAMLDPDPDPRPLPGVRSPE